MSGNPGHDLFLLMLNLSGLTSPEHIVSLFCESMSRLWAPLVFSRSRTDTRQDARGPLLCLPLSTQPHRLGSILVQGDPASSDPTAMSLIRNAVTMLGLILEKKEQERLLADRRALLENEVNRRTAELAAEITRRERVQKRLTESEERYHLAVRGSNDGIWDWRRETDEVYFSPRWKEILGYGEHELPNRLEEWRERIHPDDYARVLEANKAFFESDADKFELEYRLRHKDGSYRWIYGRGCCLRDSAGRPYRMAGAHTDITDRKEIELALSKAKNYIDNVINSMPSILVGVDPSLTVTQWNNMAEKVTGIPASQALGSRLHEVFPRLAPEDPHIETAIRDRRTLNDSRVERTDEGQVRYEDIAIYPLIANGVDGAVIRLDDVTERVRLEGLMIQSEKMLSVGGLAAGMAHEINNPLSAIIGFAQNLRNRLDKNMDRNRPVADDCGLDLDRLDAYLRKREIPRMIDGIVEAGARASRIVTNMLNFSRKSDKAMRPHSLTELMDKTLELASSDYDLKKSYDFRQISVSREYAPDLPLVLCEGNEIQQVFLNLLRNAAEALADSDRPTPQPRIIVRIRPETGFVRTEVEDNGPGMSEAVRKRVFEPFFTTKPPGKGTGLGLSVSYFIVTEQHQGRMDADSTPGQGSRFSVLLPTVLQKD